MSLEPAATQQLLLKLQLEIAQLHQNMLFKQALPQLRLHHQLACAQLRFPAVASEAAATLLCRAAIAQQQASILNPQELLAAVAAAQAQTPQMQEGALVVSVHLLLQAKSAAAMRARNHMSAPQQCCHLTLHLSRKSCLRGVCGAFIGG